MLLKKVTVSKKPHISEADKRTILKNVFLFGAGILVFVAALVLVWFSRLKLPDFNSFESRLVSRSTQIYDRTGKILLYDLHKDVKRIVVPFSDMGDNIKKATLATEDDRFYQHSGIRLISIGRSVFVNVLSGNYTQGGSTITQQVIKNTLLTQEKTVSRKLKEWILALKLERRMTKDQIFEIYLNDNNYGGNIYGIETAAQTYFGKTAKDLTLAEAAYLAAIPKSPGLYNPYGKNTQKLLDRKNYILGRMKILGMITETEYNDAKNQPITLNSKEDSKGIKAPHFVFYVKDYLESKYGEEYVNQSGLKVITTLDYDIQKKAEEIAKQRALENEVKFNAENVGIVVIDPKTGQILSMVGSRDYFDDKIDGAYNIATAKRQPGSAFKPIVYAAAFMKGFTPETVLFDVPTEFNTSCSPYGTPLIAGADCYMPNNYTGTFSGPVTVRNALARSLNIPAVKMLYMVGLHDSIKLAQELGITTLSQDGQYGLSLVLGGGEVRLLDMTSAYGTFATGGTHHTPNPILKITDGVGKTIEEFTDDENQVIPENVAYEVSSILSDNVARTPIFGANSALYFKDHQVAVKTGTTNNYRDAWIIGYTPSIVVGGWVGNNDNTPMAQKTSSMIAAPLWHELMDYVLTKYPHETFPEPEVASDYNSLKPILRGVWQTNQGIHDTLYYIDKNNPRGSSPLNPYIDPEFLNWETAVQNWVSGSGLGIPQHSSTTQTVTVTSQIN